MKTGDESRLKILKAIAAHRRAHEENPTVRQIAEAVGLTHSPTHKHLVELVRDGRVAAPRRRGTGWTLTEYGAHVLRRESAGESPSP